MDYFQNGFPAVVCCVVFELFSNRLQDCAEFLSLHSLTPLFDSIVTMDDAALKPSPEPTHLAMRQVGGTRAIMFGDTKVGPPPLHLLEIHVTVLAQDDIISATSAGHIGVGVRFNFKRKALSLHVA